MYNPLTNIERKQHIKKIVENHCKNCTAKLATDEKDACFKCLLKFLKDEILLT